MIKLTTQKKKTGKIKCSNIEMERDVSLNKAKKKMSECKLKATLVAKAFAYPNLDLFLIARVHSNLYFACAKKFRFALSENY